MFEGVQNGSVVKGVAFGEQAGTKPCHGFGWLDRSGFEILFHELLADVCADCTQCLIENERDS